MCVYNPKIAVINHKNMAYPERKTNGEQVWQSFSRRPAEINNRNHYYLQDFNCYVHCILIALAL